ncbi:MAG: hypothetical protein COT74_13715 [Bdellovibrionales bacterium CG10_big_fil_rev_8_21_14_0_10_45_34]|nr:MAG: hypothetical protein COT74_13715 [Bdellovibrionales bacterium CG10_big_fil_rev_8_21_14_0_10_45_34]
MAPLKVALLAFVFLLYHFPTLAGQETHGGDIVICDGQPPLVLDYFDAKFDRVDGEVRNVVDPDGRDIFEFYRKRISEIYTSQLVHRFHERLAKYFELVGEPGTWKSAQFSPVSDEELPYCIVDGDDVTAGSSCKDSLKNCVKYQAVLRQAGMLYGWRDRINLLSKGQKDVLKFHESVFSYLQDFEIGTPVLVRNFFTALFDKDSKTEQLADSIFRFQRAIDKEFTEYSCTAACHFTVDNTQVNDGTANEGRNFRRLLRKNSSNETLRIHATGPNQYEAWMNAVSYCERELTGSAICEHSSCLEKEQTESSQIKCTKNPRLTIMIP